MLVVPYLDGTGDPTRSARRIALGTGFSCNLIDLRQPRRHHRGRAGHGPRREISFGEFTRAGVPVALACMALAAAWIALLGG